MSVSRTLASIGLVLTVAGATLGWAYGIPRRNRLGGQVYLALEQQDERGEADERRWDTLARLGLALVAVGTLLQLAAVWID